MNKINIRTGNCLDILPTMEAGSVNCCVTSPPYFGLRDYGNDEQIGLEETPDAFVQSLVDVFREVKRVLADDGTLWLNLGDSYGDKQLIGIPWRVAFALQQDGWYLRQDIIWSKPNPMPESVTDRCTKAHEYIFLLSKKAKYFYDADAIKECCVEPVREREKNNGESSVETKKRGHSSMCGTVDTRNKRSVWEVTTKPYSGAHFATFPPDLIKPCIMAGCPAGGTVLDPFGGSGTTGMVALELGRSAELIELNPDYVEIIEGRTDVTPGFVF
jgi:DNA modification methylase